MPLDAADKKLTSLKTVSSRVKSLYPYLTPEAIIIFIVVAAHEAISIPDLAKATALSEVILKNHMIILIPRSGAGLVETDRRDQAEMLVRLTSFGRKLAERLGL